MCEEKWYSLDEQDVYEVLQSRPEGLDALEIEHRRKVYGPNTLPAKEPPTIWTILLHQVLNPLIFILLAAAVASLAIGEATDAVFILIVIALNSGLGAYEENQAEKSAASLQRLLKISARVRRDDEEVEIPSEDVVPGDIVLLESGDKAPADLRLIQANNLASDESFLTGESMAAVKQTAPLPENTGVSDRKNMVFAGSTISSGRGTGIIVDDNFASIVAGVEEGRFAYDNVRQGDLPAHFHGCCGSDDVSRIDSGRPAHSAAGSAAAVAQPSHQRHPGCGSGV